VWAPLLDPAYQFYAVAPPSRASYAAALCGLLLLAGIIGVVVELCDARKLALRLVARGLAFCLLFTAGHILLAEVIRAFRMQLWPLQAELFLALYTVGLIAVLVAAARTVRTGQTVVLILAPFAIITLAQGIWGVLAPAGGQYEAKPSTVAQTARAEQPRVVWLVFDEMDFRRSFGSRAPGLQLPAFDRLRNESLFAERAYPPAPWSQHSVPALLTGRQVVGDKPLGPYDVELFFADGSPSARWSEQLTIFDRARVLGYKTALAGSFLPYCRVMGDRLAQCSSQLGGMRDEWHAAGFRESFFTQASMLAGSMPGVLHSRRLRALFRRRPQLKPGALRRFLAVREDASALLRDPTLGLTLIHLPVPHPPAIYDRYRGGFSLAEGPTYADNLMLADRTLNEFRHAMEHARLWDRSTILVTSDHALRTSIWKQQLPSEFAGADDTYDARVPFLVKLATQDTPLVYEKEFNTVVTAELLLAILRKEIQAPEEAARWLDAHAGGSQ
jgi:hypothetical protein